MEALRKQYARGDLLFSALLVTDITTQSSLLLAQGDQRFLDRIDYPSVGPNIWHLDGIVSRKKQLLPYLIECLGNMAPN
jgi:manganese-dependent inorganic pyrophosphatase